MSFVDENVKQRVTKDYEFSFLFNPLFHEFYFTSVFKIGSFLLPTHSRDAYRKCFGDPFLFQN